MEIRKISLAICILICTIGIVVAADVSDFKVPWGYENIGNGSYTNDWENIEIDISSQKDIEDLEKTLENDSDLDAMSEEDMGSLEDMFKNDTESNYTVGAGKLNNTFNYTDGINEVIGVNELVKINGENYVIEVWFSSDTKDVSMDKLFDTLEEINSLNNIEPLDISSLDD